MPVTITTSPAATATAYSNQRKIDRCQNGVLWQWHWNNSGEFDGRYSTDNGATWSTLATQVVMGGAATYTPNASFFIDLDDYCHVVYKDRSDGYIYYRRGTPNAGRTAWTWSAATAIYSATTSDYPDVVAHREGTGWRVHLVYSQTDATGPYARYSRVDITSGGAISIGVNQLTISATNYGNSNHAWPSIDFNHTGDGKTVAGSTPHLYVAWSAGATGAGKGIRFKKATYSAGSWTWGTEREIDNTRYIDTAGRWLNCVFDGTRVVIAGQVYNGSNMDLVIHDRDAADTTTTARAESSTTLANRTHGGSLSYDSAGNLYFFGVRQSTFAVGYRKWTRASNSLASFTDLDNTSVMSDTFVSAKRGYSNNRIEFIYTDGTASPYNVTYESVILNAAPNVPTALTVTSDVLDTTPVFSVSISDPDTSQQIKGRFQIYQSDGTTLVGTVDSALRTGAGSVTAEYSSALPVGNYKVQAATVDDAGLISSYTAQVSFSVKQAIEENINLLWKTDALIVEDISYQWNVLVANQKDISFLWKTFEQTELGFSTLWGIRPPWVPVDPDPDNNPVLWEKVSP